MTHDRCPDDYHCGRPENVDPYVIPDTPIELYSSEMDAGRWRHWGGSDQWLCREHRYYLGETMPEGADMRDRYRLMEVFEAAEHATLHRHGLADKARDLEGPLQESLLSEYQHNMPRGSTLSTAKLPTEATLGVALLRPNRPTQTETLPSRAEP